MPTYQYTCTECTHELEAVQKFTDDSLTDCPACTGRLRKVFSAVGVVFKGSGFYRNDSRKDTAKGGAKESSPAGSGSGSDSGSTGSAPKDSGSKDSGAARSGEPAKSSDSSSSPVNSTPSTSGGSAKKSGGEPAA